MQPSGQKFRNISARIVYSGVMTLTTEISELTDRELYERCQEYGSQARRWKQRFCGLIPEVARRGLYRRKGFYSIYDFSAKIGGVGHETVDRILQISAKLEDKPALRSIFENGEQGWSKIQEVAYIATPETDKDFAEKVNSLSKSALSAYVHEIREKSAAGGISENIPPPPQDLCSMSFQVTGEVERQLRLLKFQLEKNTGGAPLPFNEILKHLIEKSPQPQLVVQVCPDCAKRRAAEASTRHIPAAVEKIIRARYKGTCGFRGCNLPAESLHHTARYALNPSHDTDGIVPLCKKHERLVHSSMIENEEDPPEYWRVTEKPAKNLKYIIDQKVQAHRRPRDSP